jgi:hypothetical protein
VERVRAVVPCSGRSRCLLWRILVPVLPLLRPVLTNNRKAPRRQASDWNRLRSSGSGIIGRARLACSGTQTREIPCSALLNRRDGFTPDCFAHHSSTYAETVSAAGRLTTAVFGRSLAHQAWLSQRHSDKARDAEGQNLRSPVGESMSDNVSFWPIADR